MKQLIVFIASILFFSNTFAQDSKSIPKWTMGTEKGYAQIGGGDVKAGSGFAFGIYAAKPFNNYLSLRLQLGMGDMRGLDRTPSSNWLNHPAWNGTKSAAVDYNNAITNSIFANYKTNYQEASLQSIFTFTQLPVFNNKSPFDGFLLAGIGLMRFSTHIDAADVNGGIYDFSFIDVTIVNSEAETLANLSTILDGNYETNMTNNPQFSPLFQIGAGIKWKVSDHTALSLTHRISMTGKDNLDSYLWDDNNNVEAINDIHYFTSIGVSYTFHKTPNTKKPKISAPIPQTPTIPQVEVEVEVVDLPKEEEEIVRIAFENLEFETNKAVIRKTSYTSLGDLASLLLKHSTWKLSITGHTDNVGSSESNLDLSKRRAEAVRKYLADRGIAFERFLVSWHGEQQPIADNNTKEGRQKNRRVTFEIVE